MSRCLIVFDLDIKLVNNSCGSIRWNEPYADIRRVFNKHRFKNIQGTVFLSEVGVRQAHGTLALQEVAIRFDWFAKCVSNVKFYELVEDFNAQFIVDGAAKARLDFECRVAELRQHLIGAGLSPEKISEVIGKQTFSWDTVGWELPKI